MRTTWKFVAAVIAVALVAAVSCSGNDDSIGSALMPTTTQAASRSAEGSAPPSPANLSGTVTISGSSTVEPISVRVAELFSAEEPGVEVTVDGPGTGDGFKLFCAGETDISGASRTIKNKEKADCAEAGISWIELRVGIDGIAVMTNEANEVECLNFEDLYSIVGPESSGFETWEDAAALAGDLGSSTSFPSGELVIIAPGAESGTYDSFIEIVLEDIGDARAEEGAISDDQAATTRPDYRSSGDDNVIIQGVGGAVGGFGWTGFAYAANAAGVRLLDVDGGDGCVPANPGTIASGEYPVSRSLYIYVNAEEAENSPALRAYLDYYVSDAGLSTAVGEVGYVPLTSDAAADTSANWTGRVIGN